MNLYDLIEGTTYDPSFDLDITTHTALKECIMFLELLAYAGVGEYGTAEEFSQMVCQKAAELLKKDF